MALECIFCQRRPDTGKELRELYLTSRFLSSSNGAWLCDRCRIYVLGYIKYHQIPPPVSYILWRISNFLNVRR